jgi:hypothetical protein
MRRNLQGARTKSNEIAIAPESRATSPVPAQLFFWILP